MRLLSASLAALLAAGLLAGCTGQPSDNKQADEFKGDQKAVAQVIDDLANAGRKRDGSEICKTILADSLAKSLNRGGRTCADVLDDQLKDANDSKIDIKKISITGDTATAQVESKVADKATVQTLRLQREGQAWRIAGLGS